MSAVQPTDYELAAAEALATDDSKAAEPNLDSLGARLVGEFSQAKQDRKETEERWLKDLRQYRGRYDPDEESAMGETRSKAFVRKTRVKVKTIDSRVADLLFPAGSEKNWSIDSTPVPSVSRTAIAQATQELTAANGGKQPSKDDVKTAIFNASKKAAEGMSKVIEDQLTESHYKRASIGVIHSGNLYGTGILKGPLVEKRVRTRFVQRDDGKWIARSESYVVPFVECVSVWNFYPDMQATTIGGCRYTWERHRMTKHKLSALAKNRSFKRDVIVEHIRAHRDGLSVDEYFENEIKQLGDRDAKQGDARGLFDVLERWGYIDGCDLKEIGVVVPEDRVHESFFANVWMFPNGQVIKAVLQPIDGMTWPYRLYYFDKDETSIFGEGLGSIMRDDQKMLNAAVRMMLDNAALTSGPMLEVMVGLLAGTENATEISPWKVWLRNDVRPEQAAVRSIQLPNSLEQLRALAQLFEANADETTAIPRYMTGENVASGAAATASGMSMLMGAANIVIKDLITAWDEGITRPFLEDLYRWNMKFHPDASIKGDFDVKARGTASLVAKEVRAAALDNFAQATNNPLDAPFIKRDEMLRQRAEAHELSSVVKTADEIQAEQSSQQAQQLQQMQMQMQQAQLAEQQAKAARLMAEAELAKKRMEEMATNMELTMAQTIETRVRAMFAALQAGGVATNSPYTAPAGDAVYRSAGGIDHDGAPGLAQLNGPPVQDAQGTQQLLNKGQHFVRAPRGESTVEPGAANPGQVEQPATDMPAAATGQVGRNAGIETVAVEA